jgi:hypothetical protein
MKYRLFLAIAFLSCTFFAQAQYSGPRLFLDIPSIFITAPDVSKIANNAGAGLETAFNVGTHWSVARVGGGATLTLDPKSNELGESIATTPYIIGEVGIGKYRSNGNQCAKTHRPAFTAMGKAGVRYDFLKSVPNTTVQRLDYSAGIELGYFFIRDIFKNYEVFAKSNYYFKSERISADFGFKVFLNLRADRD